MQKEKVLKILFPLRISFSQSAVPICLWSNEGPWEWVPPLRGNRGRSGGGRPEKDGMSRERYGAER